MTNALSVPAGATAPCTPGGPPGAGGAQLAAAMGQMAEYVAATRAQLEKDKRAETLSFDLQSRIREARWASGIRRRSAFACVCMRVRWAWSGGLLSPFRRRSR
jgi:hypothetical protein